MRSLDRPPTAIAVAPRRARTPGWTGAKARLAELAAIGRDFILPVAVAAAVAFALIPAPRLLAWVALLGVSTAFGRVTRAAGMTAATASCVLYLSAHARPRFAATITDQGTIRLSFLLGALGALGAAVVAWRTRPARQERQDPRRELVQA